MPAHSTQHSDKAMQTQGSAAVSRRGFWLRQFVQWHWMSAAVALVGMLLFAITGITLNHASAIEAEARTQQYNVAMPDSVRQLLQRHAETIEQAEQPEQTALPQTAARWLNQALPVHIAQQSAEWSSDEVYIALPRPGGDAWVSVDLTTGAVEAEITSRGWVAYFNDLHKGRHAGAAWGWFIDIFALACVVFSISGLLLLVMHAKARRGTWPWVAAGLVLPLLILFLFVH